MNVNVTVEDRGLMSRMRLDVDPHLDQILANITNIGPTENRAFLTLSARGPILDVII